MFLTKTFHLQEEEQRKGEKLASPVTTVNPLNDGVDKTDYAEPDKTSLPL